MKQTLNFVPVAGVSKNRLSPVAARSQLLLTISGEKTRDSLESANAHPGPAVWIPVLLLLALSFAAGYLFWAKITAAWPFAP